VEDGGALSYRSTGGAEGQGRPDQRKADVSRSTIPGGTDARIDRGIPGQGPVRAARFTKRFALHGARRNRSKVGFA